MTEQTCSLCGTHLQRPYEQHANYVSGADFDEDEEKEVHYALVHTELTKRRLDYIDEQFPERDRQALNAEMAHPDAPERAEVTVGTKTVETEEGNTETADHREVGFSIPVEQFDKVEVDSPHVGREDDDVAIVYTTTEQRPVRKTGLICRPCTTDDHEIHWGVDG